MRRSCLTLRPLPRLGNQQSRIEAGERGMIARQRCQVVYTPPPPTPLSPFCWLGAAFLSSPRLGAAKACLQLRPPLSRPSVSCSVQSWQQHSVKTVAAAAGHQRISPVRCSSAFCAAPTPLLSPALASPRSGTALRQLSLRVGGSGLLTCRAQCSCRW